MIVKSLKKFGDKTTGATYAEQVKIEEGQIFECDDALAEERIERGLVKKATKKEEKEYLESKKEQNESDLKNDNQPNEKSDEENNKESNKEDNDKDKTTGVTNKKEDSDEE